MRQEFDREIDALLRRTAARAAASDATSAAAQAAPHLDADERAAFAENALPAAARIAYVAHLADCAECRRAVAGLTASSGVAAGLVAAKASDEPAASKVRETEAVGWRAWLSALFAPRALRFVAPALALCLVGVVSYIAMRSGGLDNMTASRAPAPDAAPISAGATSNSETGSGATTGTATSSNPNASGEGAPAGLLGSAEEAGEGRASADSTGARPVTRAETGAAEAAADAGPRADQRAAGEERPAGSASEVALAATQAEPQTVAPVTPPNAAETSPEEKREENDRARNNSYVTDNSEAERANSRLNQIRGIENQQMPDGGRNQQRSSRGAGGSTAAPPPPPAARESAKLKSVPPASNNTARARRSEGRDAADENSAANEAETRSVEGRRFRRQGGAWVDVNYRDTLPTTGVRRGTAAYRALVAELPEVGRVAERLSGEVVVVARGRAYRIR
jgi:hypothetical protein